MVSELRDMLPLPPAMQRRRNFETEDRSWSPAQSPVRDAEEKKKKEVLANLPQGNRSGMESVRRLHPAGVFTPPVAGADSLVAGADFLVAGADFLAFVSSWNIPPSWTAFRLSESSLRSQTSTEADPILISAQMREGSSWSALRFGQLTLTIRLEKFRNSDSWSPFRNSFFEEKEFVSFRAIRKRWGGSSEAQEQQQKSKASSASCEGTTNLGFSATNCTSSAFSHLVAWIADLILTSASCRLLRAPGSRGAAPDASSHRCPNSS